MNLTAKNIDISVAGNIRIAKRFARFRQVYTEKDELPDTPEFEKYRNKEKKEHAEIEKNAVKTVQSVPYHKVDYKIPAVTTVVSINHPQISKFSHNSGGVSHSFFPLSNYLQKLHPSIICP